MNLEDNSGEIEIKLWGNKIDLIKEQGATVTLKGLRADIYNNRYSLNSTPSTTIEVKLHNQLLYSIFKKNNIYCFAEPICLHVKRLQKPSDSC